MSADLTSATRRRRAHWLLWAAMPLLAVAYQVAAEEIARALGDRPFGPMWLLAVLREPWLGPLVIVELVSLVAWMVVLEAFQLSEAFMISAIAYVLVVVISWTVFREPASALQVVGAGAILFGVRLMHPRGRNEC